MSSSGKVFQSNSSFNVKLTQNRITGVDTGRGKAKSVFYNLLLFADDIMCIFGFSHYKMEYAIKLRISPVLFYSVTSNA